jgi:hypothetical protein
MFKHLHRKLGTALVAFGILTCSAFSWASSHREAPGISQDPAADNTDLWAWVSTSDQTLHVVAAYNPLEEPAGGPNFHGFSDDVWYEIHITRGDQSLNDVVRYLVRFRNSPAAKVDPADLSKPVGGGKEFFAQLSGVSQTYEVLRIVGNQATKVVTGGKVAPPNIGPRTNSVAYQLPANTTYEQFAQTFVAPVTGGGKVWAGPRDDGFYVDLGGVFDLANLRPQGTAQDGVAGFNCHAIALDIPIASIPNAAANTDPKNKDVIGVWASASRRRITIRRRDGRDRDIGPLIQVSRLGLPLMNEVMIGLQDKDRYNRSPPTTDVKLFGGYYLNPVIVRDAEAVGIYSALNVPQSTVDSLKTNRTDIIDIINLKDNPIPNAHTIPLSATGDVLRLDLKDDSNPGSFPNGRFLPGSGNQETDVTDILMSVILSGGTIAISDGVNHNDANYLPTIPYLPTPWQGFDQGHGKPTQLLAM